MARHGVTNYNHHWNTILNSFEFGIEAKECVLKLNGMKSSQYQPFLKVVMKTIQDTASKHGCCMDFSKFDSFAKSPLLDY